MNVIRAAGYIRVSTAEQAQRGISLETQESEIRLYAQQHGMVLTEIYVDKGITARKQLKRRGEFMRLMRDVDAARIDIILVLRLDRWFRNVYDYHHMMNQHLTPHNVDWCAIKEDYDTTTTNGRLMINLRLAIAEQECDTDSDRIRDVQQNMLRKCCWPYGQAPIGYAVQEKKLVKDPVTQPHVEHFLQHLLQHGSMRLALHSVNQTFGTHYEYKRAQTMAKRDLYYGEYKGIPAFCPPYITMEEHQRIGYLVSKNIRVRRNGDETQVHLFTSLLLCADCGRRLSAQIIRRPPKSYHTYRCAHAADNALCPNNRTISERTMEEYLLNYLQQDLDGYWFNVQLQTQAIASPVDNRAQIKAKQERVKELFINSAIDLDEYKARINELEQQIITPSPQPQTPNLQLLKHLLESGILKLYPNMPREEKRSFWRTIIREVHVYRGQIVGEPVFL